MSKVVSPDKFNFFVPAEFSFTKGKNGEENGLVKISGIASDSTVKDSDQEELMCDGFDSSYFLSKGFFNYNHNGNKTSSAIVGEPTMAKPINGGKQYWVEGVLYPNEEGQNIVKAAETLKKYSKTRRMGFSVEGQAISRDPLNPKKIIEARITGVAITMSPKNPNTFMNIVKGEYTDPLVDEEETDIEKEMSAANTNILAPEDVEHSKKPVKNLVGLTKSQVFEKIIDRYELKDFVFINNIYNFVKSIKDNNMESTANSITPETLEKALTLLDSISKGEVPTIEKSETLVDEKSEEVKKSDEMFAFAKGMYGEGKTKDECVEGMIRKGYGLVESQTTVESVISQAEALKENGGAISNETAPIVKSEDVAKLVLDEISKSLNDTIGKSLDPLNDQIKKGFGAVNDLFKSQGKENEILKGQLNTITERLKKVEDTPITSRSVRNVAALDKFAKSENGDAPDGFRQVHVGDKIEKGIILGELESNFDLSKSNSEKEIWGDAMRTVEAVGLAGLDPNIAKRLKIQLVSN